MVVGTVVKAVARTAVGQLDRGTVGTVVGAVGAVGQRWEQWDSSVGQRRGQWDSGGSGGSRAVVGAVET
eukprot:3603774-Pyramimonas_sp.AAC.1